MSGVEILIVLVAAVWAGLINTVVGSGTLVTFPALLLVGIPPLTANASNGLGLLGGGVSGMWGYRRELSTSAARVLRLLPWALLGGATGAVLLLALPPQVFEVAVPVLILLGLALVVLGPRIQEWVRRHHHEGNEGAGEPAWMRRLLPVGVGLVGVYGGYFGAAQGVILMGVLGVLVALPLQVLNGWKNLLATANNAASSLVFLVLRPGLVRWDVVGVLVIGSLVGGWLGARVGRRLPPTVLRAVIVLVGLVGIAVAVGR
ncbi:sulfite exporter TauE/SafE family protein [Janibacter massiliensis]|uniref:sulfite exporter TauE/SafE family protein n=1 Tax=Janibacter massiliensis TaxID=2058291 RepID=UPI000D0ED999|nr:sulfite exporter TauE/SafE family protein [Janibacter massiliensis]